MSDDPHTEPTSDEELESTIDPAPIDIDAEDIAEALPHRDDPDQDPPGAAGAPVPPG
jgi:hypothetical protein